jgi:hypothetical protein
MEARRAHRGEPPFFTTNLGARSVFVKQQPQHARVTLMKVAVSVFRKRAWDADRIARAWVVLMKRLGYSRFVSPGGDLGAIVSEVMALQTPPELLGIHVSFPAAGPSGVPHAPRFSRPSTNEAKRQSTSLAVSISASKPTSLSLAASTLPASRMK